MVVGFTGRITYLGFFTMQLNLTVDFTDSNRTPTAIVWNLLKTGAMGRLFKPNMRLLTRPIKLKAVTHRHCFYCKETWQTYKVCNRKPPPTGQLSVDAKMLIIFCYSLFFYVHYLLISYLHHIVFHMQLRRPRSGLRGCTATKDTLVTFFKSNGSHASVLGNSVLL